MSDVNIGPASEFEDPGRKVIEVNGVEIGVYKLGSDFFAYENICPHMGGPVCQGRIIAKIDEVIADDRTSKGLAFSKTQLNAVCPWHAYEFDIRTGQHAGNRKLRLKSVKVRVSDQGDVIVTVPEDARARADAGDLAGRPLRV